MDTGIKMVDTQLWINDSLTVDTKAEAASTNTFAKKVAANKFAVRHIPPYRHSSLYNP